MHQENFLTGHDFCSSFSKTTKKQKPKPPERDSVTRLLNRPSQVDVNNVFKRLSKLIHQLKVCKFGTPLHAAAANSRRNVKLVSNNARDVIVRKSIEK